jgi:polyphenol oxidase
VTAPLRWDGDHLTAELPGARVLFTTRRGGVSAPPYDTLNLGPWTDDDPAAVEENRARARVLAGGRALAQGHQVHEAVVTRVDGPVPGVAEGADGQPAPAAVQHGHGPLPGHGGWRGLAGGIVAEGVRALRELGATGELAAAIGPGAGGCCYETGDEVRARFRAEHARGRHLDLKAVAAQQLREAGVAEVHDAGVCTLCAEPGLLFSHRRDGGLTGRQAGIAWRT